MNKILILLSTLIIGNSFGQSDRFSHHLCDNDTIIANLLDNDPSLVTSIDKIKVNGVYTNLAPNSSTSFNLDHLFISIASNGAIEIHDFIGDRRIRSFQYFTNTLDSFSVSIGDNICLDNQPIDYTLDNCNLQTLFNIDLNLGSIAIGRIISGRTRTNTLSGNLTTGYLTTILSKKDNPSIKNYLTINQQANNGIETNTFVITSDGNLLGATLEMQQGITPPNSGIYILEFQQDDTLMQSIIFEIQDCDPVAHCRPSSVDIFSPFLRRCDTATYYVNYDNYNATALNNGYIDVELDENLTFVSSNQAHTNLGNGTIRFNIGTLPAWSWNTNFSFDVYVNCDSTIMGQIHCVTAELFPHNTCTSGIDTNIVVEPVDSTVSDSVYFRVFSNQNNITTQYRIYEDHLLGERGTINVGTQPRTVSYRRNRNASLHRLELDAVSRSIHVNQTPSANLESDSIVDTTGIVNEFPLSDGEPWVSTYCRQNVDSYDPNLKEAFPVGYGTQHYINQNVDLDYVIHFQNEGTADAIRVVVEDELDADLDLNTFVAGAATHPYEVIRNGRTIKFIFNNIYLAPKSQNEAASMGAVKFSIRQNVNNPIGTFITNSAKIYFDYNAPIITNTVQHLVGKPEIYSLVSIEEVQSSIKLNIFPNPATEVVNFTTLDGTSIYELELIDLSGRVLQSQVVNATSTQLNVNHLSKGVYFYQIQTEKGKSTGKIIVQ